MTEWEKKASGGDIVEALWSYVQENDWTIYPDLVADFKPYMPTEGNYTLRVANHVVLWSGISANLAIAIGEAINANRLVVLPISKTVYSLSGFKPPALPLVEYRKNMADPPEISWSPTCLRIAKEKKKKK